MKRKNILIDILKIGRESLEEGKEITIKELEEKLESLGYEKSLICNALELFYPENFKGYYGKGTWLSSDGHIRLLQYESLKASKKNLNMAIWMLIIAFLTLFTSLMFNDKEVVYSIKSIEQKQDSILMELKKINYIYIPDTLVKEVYPSSKKIILDSKKMK
jgi:hypothetical protein